MPRACASQHKARRLSAQPACNMTPSIGWPNHFWDPFISGQTYHPCPRNMGYFSARGSYATSHAWHWWWRAMPSRPVARLLLLDYPKSRLKTKGPGVCRFDICFNHFNCVLTAMTFLWMATGIFLMAWICLDWLGLLWFQTVLYDAQARAISRASGPKLSAASGPDTCLHRFGPRSRLWAPSRLQGFMLESAAVSQQAHPLLYKLATGRIYGVDCCCTSIKRIVRQNDIVFMRA